MLRVLSSGITEDKSCFDRVFVYLCRTVEAQPRRSATTRWPRAFLVYITCTSKCSCADNEGHLQEGPAITFGFAGI